MEPPALPFPGFCRGSNCIISSKANHPFSIPYARILSLCIKVINIIHNICTKFGGIGTFFVDVFVGFSTKALLFIVSTYLENWLHV